ncbi:hypothetical protein JCM10212_004117 [Sporobolomyces blumeae]
MESLKRSRSASSGSASSSQTTPPASPSTKAARPSSPPPATYTCSLAPTCDRKPSTFSTSEALDGHWRSYHAFVCQARPSTFEFARLNTTKKGKERALEERDGGSACGRVFPDERTLQLHLTECHDEMAQIRLERGEKIFACLQATCSLLFSTPKTRRLHLIGQHGYPKEYFFGVTIWGVGEVLKKGGGMVRREWRPRPGQSGYRERDGSATGASEDEMGDEPPSPLLEKERSLSPSEPVTDRAKSDEIDDLTLALSGTSISFVPRAVRKANKTKMLA